MGKWLIVGLILLVGGLMVWAHGDDDDEPDHRESVDMSDVDVPENPTYYEHIKPLLELHCNACHREGQISGDIPLTDVEDVEKGSSDIAFNVSIGYMPPWMPSRLNLPLKHNRSLSDTEIATFIKWNDIGAPLGDPEDYAPPTDAGYDLSVVRADLILQPEEPYVPDENVQDDYRCFAFQLDIEEPLYVTGYEFMPEVAEMAHHGLVYLVGEGAQSAIERRNYEDGRIGWSCYGGVGLSTRSDMIGAWAPGTLPTLYPEDTGYLLEPGDSLIIQMHYNLAITRQPDQTVVNLQLEESVSEELISLPLTAPVEIPCPTGVEGPQCNRISALDRVAKLYGQEAHYFPDSLLQDCDQTLADYADNTGENAIGYCDYPIPGSMTLYGVFGHMHELGRSFRLELNPDSDDPDFLLDIPNWDFHWQDGYQFVEPILVGRGDVIRMTCHWDNTLSEDPRYVVWGEGTQDEMCFSIVMVVRS